MRFGMYLIQRGKITADQLVRAIQAQQATRPPLGQLAIELGHLCVRDVLRILRVQSDLTHDRFGDTAIELGLMTRRDVAELLLMQSDRETPLDEVLVNIGAIDFPACRQELAAYRQQQEQPAGAVDGSVRRIACPDRRVPEGRRGVGGPGGAGRCGLHPA